MFGMIFQMRQLNMLGMVSVTGRVVRLDDISGPSEIETRHQQHIFEHHLCQARIIKLCFADHRVSSRIIM